MKNAGNKVEGIFWEVFSLKLPQRFLRGRGKGLREEVCRGEAKSKNFLDCDREAAGGIEKGEWVMCK